MALRLHQKAKRQGVPWAAPCVGVCVYVCVCVSVSVCVCVPHVHVHGSPICRAPVNITKISRCASCTYMHTPQCVWIAWAGPQGTMALRLHQKAKRQGVPWVAPCVCVCVYVCVCLCPCVCVYPMSMSMAAQFVERL